MLYIGLDPGNISGAIAWIVSQHTVCDSRRFKDMTEKELSNLIRELKEMHSNVVAIVEKIWAFPNQGVSSGFKFGENYGLLRGLLLAYDIPHNLVTPKTWQKFYGMEKDKLESKPQGKKRLRGKAQEIFPLSKVGTETADAILIAEYARKCF